MLPSNKHSIKGSKANYISKQVKLKTYGKHFPPFQHLGKKLFTYPVHYGQGNSHVKSAVSKVDSLWTVNQNNIVEGLYPVGVATRKVKDNIIVCIKQNQILTSEF